MTLASPRQPQTDSPQPTTVTLDVDGMKCAGCVSAVERQLLQQPGVKTACVNLITAVAVVEYQGNGVPPEALAAKLTTLGFPSQLRPANQSMTQSDRATQRQQKQQRQRWQITLAAILLLLSSLGHWQHFGGPNLPGLSQVGFHWGLATIALGLTWRSIVAEGWRGLRQGRPNMNTLVGLGALSAYSASCLALIFPGLGWECFFDEPVMLLGFILLGRTLESRARERAADSLEALLVLQPQSVHLIGKPQNLPSENNTYLAPSTIEIPVEQVRVGEWVQVLPGEKIPVDGIVVAGQTSVNEAMLTGESLPVAKQSGDEVTAGTLNDSGAITVRTERTGNQTTLAQIIATVEAAQARKAPIQNLADTVAGYFAYGVMAISAVTFFFWYGLGTRLWPDLLLRATHPAHTLGMHAASTDTALLLSLKLAIAVLVIACPCALGLATPTAILVGTSLGAERGLLIKGGDILEQVHQLDTILFDKTGTLTQGQPELTDCRPLGNRITSSRLLQLAAATEKGTNHPLGTAIVQAAQAQELALLPGRNFHTATGLGIAAIIEQHQMVVGNGAWLSQQAIAIDPEANRQAQTWATEGKTPIFVACDGQLVGLLALQDPLRPEAKATVQTLQQMGLDVMLLSGDRDEVVQAIAQSLGLSQAWAEVTPTRKAAIVRELQTGNKQQHQRPLAHPPERSRCIAMVGDGINDAPALAQADIGITLQSGTAVALDTAELVLMRGQLTDVVAALQLSHATFHKIRQNLTWAFSYNVIAIPIAAGALLPLGGVMLSPGSAGALMATSSIAVVINSLLLRRHAAKLGMT